MCAKAMYKTEGSHKPMSTTNMWQKMRIGLGAQHNEFEIRNLTNKPALLRLHYTKTSTQKSSRLRTRNTTGWKRISETGNLAGEEAQRFSGRFDLAAKVLGWKWD
ncbi:hypothetical protein CEXT_749321 [Caerostris extrusa]|uniref:Uncharacterized protein n=1 Tax=Caerostris extrusa TaxID=172846 RepID=A0AAV4Y599_CAEEX|nr:hypothetical protein CEXT_749321 [Caerostris extrusa]